MAYKNNMILGGLMVLLGSIFFFGRAQAGTITFEGFSAGDTISSRYSMVHFALPNEATNDYQGGIFWFPSIELKTAEKLIYGEASEPNKTRTCRKQIRGLYYNIQRGNRLWPMDTESLKYLKQINSNYNSLSMVGGWYTTCSGGQNQQMPGSDIYGQITFTEPTYGDSTLSAGLMYTINNTISDSLIGFYPSLSYYNNETPVGYLFDSLGISGSVGFVGGRFDNHTGLLNTISGGTGINDILTGSTKSGICYNGSCIYENLEAGLNSALYLSILGNTLFSRGGLDLENRRSVIGNISSTSTIMFSDLINISDILNELRRNASSLCVGKNWIAPSGFPGAQGSVVCIKDPTGVDPVVIDLSDTDSYDRKDIIVQGKDVILKNTMSYDNDDNLPMLNIFIDQGNLYLKPDTPQFNGQTTGSYRKFDANALPVGFTGGITTGSLNNPTAKQFAYAQLLRGNIFVNGVVAGFSGSTISDPAPGTILNKYYIYGRLASLNTALAPSEKRKTMVRSMFGENTSLVDYLSLSSDVFMWRCGLGAVGSFGTDGTPCAVLGDYQINLSAFILMKEYIPTNLFQ